MATILVIEDEFTILDVIKDTLSIAGYKVVPASNSRLGIKLAFQKPTPDLILCDINMPDKNGFQVIEEIKRIPHVSNTPYIFISARAAKEDIKKGITFGAEDYITKPFTASELLYSVENQLKKINRFY